MARRPATTDDRSAVLARGVREETNWFGEAETSAEDVAAWIDEEGGIMRGVFGELERAGARDVMLGVEAENEGALRLYRSVGMEVEREWRVYTI